MRTSIARRSRGARGAGRWIPLGLLTATLALPTPALEPVVRSRQLMGTACTATTYAGPPGAAAAALDRIAAVESILSTWRQDSELSRLNRTAGAGPVPVSEELGAFLDAALGIAAQSGGAFDPTIGPLVDLWDLRGEGRVPSEEERRQALATVGFRRVVLDRSSGTARYASAGMWIDAGGIGKGFALDRAATGLHAADVQAALLDFGGQLLAIGAPPGESAWTVAIADPRRRDRPALLLSLRDASAATSAQSERGRQVGGRWIGHILDPRTARPVERPGSVTVIAASATEADALATALFVMGSEDGLAWAEARGEIAVGYLEPSADGERLRLRANERFHRQVVARREFVDAGRPGDREGADEIPAAATVDSQGH